MADLIEKLHGWTERKLQVRLSAKYGMTRQCPWCRQCVESNGEHQMRAASHCEFFDTFVCGVCGGESHWEFGPVPMSRGLGKPPTPARWAVDADKEVRRILGVSK